MELQNIKSMKYLTDTISAPLAEKLKEKGMPMEVWQEWGTPYISVVENSEYDWLDKELGNEPSTYVEKRYSVPSYAEVFDWLMEKGIYIDGYPIYHITNKCYTNEWCFYVMSNDITQEKEADYESFGTWHEAAEKAIEKALTLI